MTSLRLADPRSSVVGEASLSRDCCGQSGATGEKALRHSGFRLLAGEVLWSSVIMIGLETPAPTTRPTLSSIVKRTRKPTFSR